MRETCQIRIRRHNSSLNVARERYDSFQMRHSPRPGRCGDTCENESVSHSIDPKPPSLTPVVLAYQPIEVQSSLSFCLLHVIVQSNLVHYEGRKCPIFQY